MEIPEEIQDEIWKVSKPLDVDGSPSFVFDFLTCKIDDDYSTEQINIFPATNFHWVEVKTGDSELSRHQEEVRNQCMMKFDIFRIENVEPVDSALFEMMVDLIRGRLSPDVLNESLDPEVLALIVEEGNQNLSDETIKDVLDNRLARAQGKRYGVETEELQKAFRDVSNQITARTQDPSLWPIYSSTGLSAASCEIVKNSVLANKETIAHLVEHSDIHRKEELIQLFLQMCLPLREMDPGLEISASSSDLLSMWIDGKSITALANEFPEIETEVLAKFIERFFSYLLPWGFLQSQRLQLQCWKLRAKNSRTTSHSSLRW